MSAVGCSSFQAGGFQTAPHSPSGLFRFFRRYMGINTERHSRVAVSHQMLYRCQIDAARQQPAAIGVTQLVKPHWRQTVLLQKFFQLFFYGVRIVGFSVLPDIHITDRVHISVSQVQLVLGLLFLNFFRKLTSSSSR